MFLRLFILCSLVIPTGMVQAKARIKCPSLKSTYQYDRIILDASRKFSLDAALIHAVIKQESCYDRFAVSHAGAEGLMQLMPATARRFKAKNSFIPKQNIYAGANYLAWLLKRFKGDIRFALAAYNAGEGAVEKYKGIPPYKETKRYVSRVITFYSQFKGLAPARSKKKKKMLMAKIRRNSGLDGLRVSKFIRQKQPTGLENKRTYKKESKAYLARVVKPTRKAKRSYQLVKTRVRVSSITLANNYEKKGYTRVNAKSFKGRTQNAS